MFKLDLCAIDKEVPMELYNIYDIIELKDPSLFVNRPILRTAPLYKRSDLFNLINYKHLKEYSKLIEKILYDYLFPGYVKEFNKKKGIFLRGKWASFNRMNTNINGIIFTINYLNRYVLEKEIFLRADRFNEDWEYFMNILEYVRDIFSDSDLLIGFLKIIKTQEKRDDSIIKALCNFFEGLGYTIESVGGSGNYNDMVLGIDIKLKKDHQCRSIQVKPYKTLTFERITNSKGFYCTITGVGNAKRYDSIEVDYFIFYKVVGNNLTFYRIKNEKVKINPGGYTITLDKITTPTSIPFSY
jgi:hypothetical protein